MAVWLTAALLLCATTPASDANFADGIALQTELKTSGPRVSVRFPLGLKYRPGTAVPVEVRVHNPGAAFTAELFIVEGAGDDGVRGGIFEAQLFAPNTTRILTLPVRLPPVSAEVTLHIRARDESGNIGPQLFRASLARAAKPLPPEARVVLYCSNAAAPGWMSDTVRIAAKDLPAAAWMYESVDLVVLGDGSLRDASPEAREALGLWLAGGGRLFVASADAIAPAAAAKLLPVAPDSEGRIGSDRAWWEKHAGLKAADILKESNNRPVYIALRRGFGRVLCLFPGTSNDDARRFGAEIANHPLLSRSRDLLPDARVQPDRFNAFVFGEVDSARRGNAGIWALIGGVVLCAGLLLGRSSKTLWMAAGWPLSIAALLGVMLAQWFPPRDLSQSRVTITRHAADGTVLAREWTLFESHQQPGLLAVQGPESGSLQALYSDSTDARQALFDLRENGGGLFINELLVSPQSPVLLAAARTGTAVGAPPRETLRLHSPEGATAVTFRSRANSVTSSANSVTYSNKAGESILERGVLARDGELLVIEKGRIKRFESWPALVRASDASLNESQVKARAAVLLWASREALREKSEKGNATLIVWRGEHNAKKGLIEVEERRMETASAFSVETYEAKTD